MSTDLIPYENALAPVRRSLDELLAPAGIPRETFTQAAFLSVERTPTLRECSMESFVAAVTSLAVLALLPDGVTGQGFLIPFRVRGVPQVQPIVGYKGFNTLGWRAGYTIRGEVVREGDEFDWSEGSRAFVHHKKLLGGPADRTIIAAYAVAESRTHPAAQIVLDHATILATKAKSPGAKKSDSPWNDPVIGFPAMAIKTAKRRLHSQLPVLPALNGYHRAAAMETQHEELGRAAYLREDGQLVTSEAAEPVGPARLAAPRYEILMGDGSTRSFTSLQAWAGQWRMIIDKLGERPAVLADYHERNRELLMALGEVAVPIDMAIREALAARKEAA